LSAGAYDSYFVQDGSTPFPINYWKGRSGGLTMRACVGIVLDRIGWSLGKTFGSQVYNNEQPSYFYLDGSTAWEQLKELGDSFVARLFFLRDGRLFAMDRLDPNGMAAGLAAPIQALKEEGLSRTKPFDSLRNRVEVLVRPHSVTPFKSPILTSYFMEAWNNGGPIALEPMSVLEIPIKMPGGLNKPVAGNYVRCNSDALSESKPHAVWSAADRTGTNMGATTGNGEGIFELLLQQIGENQNGLTYVQSGNNQAYCKVKLTNNSSTRTAYFFDLQVQVIGLRETGQGLKRIAESADSITMNGKRLMQVNARWVQNAYMADNVAQSYLDNLSTRDRASTASVSYHWKGADLYNKLAQYDVGSFVDFGNAGGASSLANFGLSGRWLIIGQEITWISPSGQNAKVKLTFERPPLLNVLAGNVSSASGSNVASISWNHTVAAGNNRILIVTLAKRDYYGMATSVTYGGQPMVGMGHESQGLGDYPFVQMFYLLAPAAGTAAVTVTLAAAEYFQAGAVDFRNVRQSYPWGSPASISSVQAANGPAVLNLKAEPGNMMVDVICYRGAAATPGDGQTLQWTESCDGNWRGSCSIRPAGQAQDMRWTVPAGGFAQMGVSIYSSGG
jgi:hypothetical protein